MSQQKPALQSHDLSIGYQSSRQPDKIIAQHLNLTLKRGELVGLLGPNGAGKSTLMRTLAGMQKPLNGQVTLSGDNAHTIPSSDRAKRLSVVLTDRPNMGLMNGYALVALGRHPYTNWTGQLSAYDEAVIQWAIDVVHARDIADQPVMALSDGQRQKLMIARALAQESDVILLDEPTAYLDLPRRVEIMQLLKHLAYETHRAVLLSTHDLDLALRSCDEMWLMADGHIRTGTPEDLVINDSIAETFYSEGVRFDKQTGSFSLSLPTTHQIHVDGEGVAALWTRRALQRQNYQVVNTPAEINIKVDETYDTIWIVSIGEQIKTYHSIHDLLQAVREYHIKHNNTDS